jgi:hypothetical protein
MLHNWRHIHSPPAPRPPHSSGQVTVNVGRHIACSDGDLASVYQSPNTGNSRFTPGLCSSKTLRKSESQKSNTKFPFKTVYVLRA